MPPKVQKPPESENLLKYQEPAKKYLLEKFGHRAEYPNELRHVPDHRYTITIDNVTLSVYVRDGHIAGIGLVPPKTLPSLPLTGPKRIC